MLTQNRHIDQLTRIVNPEIIPHTYSQLVFNKGGQNVQWGEESLQQGMLGKLDSHMQINKARTYTRQK